MTLASAILSSHIRVVLHRFSESTIEMDGRDRDTNARYDDRPPRLRSSSSSTSRRGGSAGFNRFDDDLELSEDPPSWQDRFGSARRRDQLDVDRSSERRPRREEIDASRAPSPRSRSSRQAHDDVIDERMPGAVADPYDRLRRVTERRGRRLNDEPPVEAFEVYDDQPAPVRSRSARLERELVPASRPTRSTRPNLPQPQFRAVGSMLARSSQDAGALAPLSGAAVASAVALTILTLVRIGSTSDWLVTRLDAGGEPIRWATNESLWRVPLLVLFSTIAGLVVAWRLRRHDAFAAQFTLVSVLLLHGFGWVAAGRLLF